MRSRRISGPTAYFGTNKVTWTLTATAPLTVVTQRTYRDVNGLMREIDNARIWAGLHWRQSMRHGAQVGRKVARTVTRNYFLPVQ